MSDLAPFVAEALRDKVVSDLKKEKDDLRRKLRNSRSVEITGPEGTPLYARAIFDEDGGYDHNSEFWNVIFPEEQPLSCPLSDLETLEVRLGGVRMSILGDERQYRCLTDRNAEKGRQTITFLFMKKCWLHVEVKVNSEEEPVPIPLDEVEQDETVRYLSRVVAAERQGMTLHFHRISFFCEAVRGFIENLHDEQTIEQAKKQKEDRMRESAVITYMKEAGFNDREIASKGQLEEIRDALKEMDIKSHEESFESIVSELLTLQGQHVESTAGERREAISRFVEEAKSAESRSSAGVAAPRDSAA